MGLYDAYRPAEPLSCPVCAHPLSEWQGKDGPCALFVWAEGIAEPVGQYIDEEAWPQNDLGRTRLPPTFVIDSYDCPRHAPIEAECAAPDGVWNRTTLLPFPGPR